MKRYILHSLLGALLMGSLAPAPQALAQSNKKLSDQISSEVEDLGDEDPAPAGDDLTDPVDEEATATVEDEATDMVGDEEDMPADGDFGPAKPDDLTRQSDEPPPKPEPPYPGSEEEGFNAPATIQPSKTAETSAPVEAPAGVIRPISITASGDYFYGYDNSKQSSAMSARFGFFGPPDIVNPKNGLFFEDIYTQAQIPTLFVDYEWQLLKVFGSLGLKVGSGIFVSQGKGRFEDPSRASERPPEKFTFIMLPNTVSGIYRFRYADKQILMPYVEGGGGYFTFAETRDDNKGTKYGAAPVSFAAAGLGFLLDWIDPQAIRNLDRDYGINHVYLNAEYRAIIGLNKTYDFTSSVLNAGISMEF